jgi:hypothetical protein
MQKAVNVLIMQGNSDDEEEEIHQMLLQDTPVAVEGLKPENAEATVQATAAVSSKTGRCLNAYISSSLYGRY